MWMLEQFRWRNCKLSVSGYVTSRSMDRVLLRMIGIMAW
jgi:hypothetical protein